MEAMHTAEERRKNHRLSPSLFFGKCHSSFMIKQLKQNVIVTIMCVYGFIKVRKSVL